MILAGPYAPNVTELFEDEMCDKLFQTIKEENYDIVILDTAPVGTVIDAAILTKYADGAALVAESEVTSRRVILNKVNMTKGGYYNSYYKKYGKKYEKYGYGYGYGPQDASGNSK